jgi:hypothetical protein
MTRIGIKVSQIALAVIAGFACLFATEKTSLIKSGSLVTSAHAIIGRPLTPMSYAGVARRSAVGVGVGVAVGAAVAAPVVVAPMCAQVVNVYGQITTVCR